MSGSWSCGPYACLETNDIICWRDQTTMLADKNPETERLLDVALNGLGPEDNLTK